MELEEYLEKNSEYLYNFLMKISQLSDSYAIFDALLTESRQLANADAGTLYILKNNELVFAAAQNDTLFPASAANKYAYMNVSIPLDSTSIAGHVALTGESLKIADVQWLNSESSFVFNDSFDQKTGYKTRSMLVVPLVNGDGKVMGVLQLINAMKENGDPATFNKFTSYLVARMANMATLPLEKALLVVNMIMRMLKTSALRDPSETASHVQRVGSLSAELYQTWAEGRNIAPEELLANKSRLRLAAMLHDIGKVGIPDEILKKPDKLTDEERQVMQTHSALGASLFNGINNEIEKMVRDIALHHHARWDGKGYTGAKDIASPAGEDIPVWARIVAIADVFDALVSKRCYKDAWDKSRALQLIQMDAGAHFDPELVACFTRMSDLAGSIYNRYDEANEAARS